MGRLVSVDQDGVSLELPLDRTLLKRMMASSRGELNGGHDGSEGLLKGLQMAASEVGDEVEADGGRIRITHRTVGHLSQEIADAVGLPPLVELTFCADMTGLVGSPDFRLIYGWRHAGRREFARRKGAILETPGVGSSGLRRLPLWMLDAAEISSKVDAEDAPEFHWAALAKFRRAIDPAARAGGVGADAKVSMTHYLGSLRIALAECFAINPTGADQFDIVPVFYGAAGGTVSGVEATERELGLPNGSLRQFRRVVARRGACGVFNLGRQCHLVVDPTALPVLRVLAKMQRGSPESRAEFVRDPRPSILEAIAEELRVRGKLEGLSPKEKEDLVERTAKAAFLERWDPSAGDTKPVNADHPSVASGDASDAEFVKEGPWRRAKGALCEADDDTALEAGSAGDVEEREDEKVADIDGTPNARHGKAKPSPDSDQDDIKSDAAEESEKSATEASSTKSDHVGPVEEREQNKHAEATESPHSSRTVDMPDEDVGKSEAENDDNQEDGSVRGQSETAAVSSADSDQGEMEVEKDSGKEKTSAKEDTSAKVDRTPPGERDWDASQIKVIKASRDARLVVDAGPGTGKTAVACARLAHLIREEDLEPVNALMISFTRTAVAEIRARLQSYVGDAAHAIRIATIDSHAWAIHSGHVQEAKLTGSFDDNIEEAIKLLKSDEDVLDELDRLEHVVIDEAQDIVGLRAELIGLLVEGLADRCGVTVFADEAQAIYGFSDESDGNARADGGGGQPLLDRLKAVGGLNFNQLSLDNIHRTSSPGLRRIFSEVRHEVLDPNNRKKGQARQTADMIVELADERGLQGNNMNLEEFDSDTLVLFRSRVEVLMASQFCHVPHRLRLSGYGATLPPWLGMCFFDFTEAFLNKDDFNERWSDRVGSIVETDWDSTKAWHCLLQLAGKGEGLVDMERLRQRLGRSRPPAELASAEYGFHGPIAGTIHASKGREAPKVALLLPAKPGGATGDIDGEAEEARVLFVGATRAKDTLSVGTGSGAVFTSKSLDSGRVYRRAKNGKMMVEIGRLGDISPKGLVGREAMDEESAAAAQAFLADVAYEVTCYSLIADSKLGWRHIILADQSDLRVGVLEPVFRQALWNVVSNGKKGKNRPPRTLRPVRAQGCSTMVLPSDSPDIEVLNEPWASSGFVLAPRIVAFPPFKMF